MRCAFVLLILCNCTGIQNGPDRAEYIQVPNEYQHLCTETTVLARMSGYDVRFYCGSVTVSGIVTSDGEMHFDHFRDSNERAQKILIGLALFPIGALLYWLCFVGICLSCEWIADKWRERRGKTWNSTKF